MTGEHPREFVAQGGGEKPDAHDEAEQSLRRELRHRAQAHRAQAHLTDRLQEKQSYNPKRADFPLGRQFRRRDHQHKRETEKHEPEHELEGARGLPFAQRHPQPREQRREHDDEDRIHRLE